MSSVTMQSATTWGNPNAAKHVLLIHGLTSFSQFWHHIGSEFASRGKCQIRRNSCERSYFVTAPDLLGHGNAGRGGTDYTIATLTNQLRPYISISAAKENNHPYQIVIGHSLGGIIVSALLPHLNSTHPVHVILTDPPLEQTTEQIAAIKSYVHESIGNLKSFESYQSELSPSIREHAYDCLSKHLCDPAAMDAILDQNLPWSFSHNLSIVPDNVRVTVLAADPTKGAMVKEEDLKVYPHVTTKTVWGASHGIPGDAPWVIFEVAFGGNEPQN